MLTDLMKGRHTLPRACLLTTLFFYSSVAAEEVRDPAPSLGMSLDSITVTATLAEQTVRLAPASGSVVSREDIKQRNAGTLLSAMKSEPGVTFTRAGGIGRKAFSLRGMEAKHSLLLIDGRRVPTSDDVFGHADYEYGWVPMSQIERIEIVRGPMSTLYGSDALGGVVNMITRKPGKEWAGGVSLNSATTANKKKAVGSGSASVYAAGQLHEKLGVRLVGETSGQGKTKNPHNKQESELEGSLKHNGGATAFLTLTPEQTVQLQYNQGHEERYFDAEGGREPNVYYYENRYTIDRSEYDVTWDGHFSEWVAQARAYRSKIEVSNWRSGTRSQATKPQALTDEVLDGHVSRYLGKHWLTLGTEFRRETLANKDLENNERKARHKAVFIQDEIELTESLHFTAGVRYNRQSPYSSELTPRAYLVWEATPNVVVKGGYGRGFRTPTLKQSSSTYHSNIGGFQFHGNDDIKPEKADSYELGVDWQFERVALNATLFHSEIKNLIDNRPIDPTNPFIHQFVNVNKARISGVETGMAWQVHPDVEWGGSMNVLKTKDLTTRKELLYRPRITVNSFVGWQLMESLSARVHVEHTGKQEAESNLLDGSTSPRYTLWGASVAKQFNEHFSLRGGVDNIGDVHLARKAGNFRIVERGRTVFLNAEFEF